MGVPNPPISLRGIMGVSNPIRTMHCIRSWQLLDRNIPRTVRRRSLAVAQLRTQVKCRAADLAGPRSICPTARGRDSNRKAARGRHWDSAGSRSCTTRPGIGMLSLDLPIGFVRCGFRSKSLSGRCTLAARDVHHDAARTKGSGACGNVRVRDGSRPTRGSEAALCTVQGGPRSVRHATEVRGNRGGGCCADARAAVCGSGSL